MAQLAEKPTAAAPRVGKQGDPCVMVIFGAAGDLTARMLIPALYNLARADCCRKNSQCWAWRARKCRTKIFAREYWTT